MISRQEGLVKNSIVKVEILDKLGNVLSSREKNIEVTPTGYSSILFADSLIKANVWDINTPYLYKARVSLYNGKGKIDEITIPFGIRSTHFDKDKGFFLNDKALKIYGVCMHHDLGALGAAFNKTAANRQLKILKEMGCNAIRFAHNPPATEMLDLCDQMGFLVIDEAFDMWYKKKNKYDYHKDFKEWYKRDLEDTGKKRSQPSFRYYVECGQRNKGTV